MEGTKTKPFTIGRLAQEAGINLETVRFYERYPDELRGGLGRSPALSITHGSAAAILSNALRSWAFR
jgi:hypothetical protein